MTMPRWAQDAPQWDTRVEVERSQQQIMDALRRFGVERFAIDYGEGAIGFTLGGNAYLLKVRPMPFREPEYVPSHRAYQGLTLDQYRDLLTARAWRQAWRVYHDYVESVVKYAWFVSGEASLLPYLLVGPNTTLAEVPVRDVAARALPAPE